MPFPLLSPTEFGRFSPRLTLGAAEEEGAIPRTNSRKINKSAPLSSPFVPPVCLLAQKKRAVLVLERREVSDAQLFYLSAPTSSFPSRTLFRKEDSRLNPRPLKRRRRRGRKKFSPSQGEVVCPEEDEEKSFHEKGELNRVPAPDIHYLAPSRMMEGVPQTQTDEEKVLVYLGAPA